MEENTDYQLDGLRKLAENLSGKKLGNVKDPVKLQLIIDEERAKEEDVPNKIAPLTKAAKRIKARKAATKLVRVNITAMAPFDKQLQGNYFSIGNSLTGKITRYIPFGVDWYIEDMLLTHLKDRKYRTKHESKDPVTRRPVYENRFHKSFGIIELENMTAEEYEEHKTNMRSRKYGERA